MERVTGRNGENRNESEELRLVEASKDTWQLVPTDYGVHKVTGTDDGTRNWTVNNRLAAQPIKLRIETLSPAWKLGFKPLPLDQMGLVKDRSHTSLPKDE